MATTEELLELVLNRLDKMNEKIDFVQKGQDYLTAKVESELMNKVEALFDAREVSLESDRRLEQKIDTLTGAVDSLRIEMLKGFKDIKEDRRSITELLGEHSVEIRTLARKTQ